MVAGMNREVWGLDDSIGYLARIAFRRFSAAVERRTSMFGISAGQYALLRRLWEEDAVAQHRLADRMGVCEPTIAVMVRRLEEMSMIRRVTNSSNRRETLVVLDEKGIGLAAPLAFILRLVSKQATADLSADEVACLEGLLQRVAANLASAERLNP